MTAGQNLVFVAFNFKLRVRGDERVDLGDIYQGAGEQDAVEPPGEGVDVLLEYLYPPVHALDADKVAVGLAAETSKAHVAGREVLAIYSEGVFVYLGQGNSPVVVVVYAKDAEALGVEDGDGERARGRNELSYEHAEDRGVQVLLDHEVLHVVTRG